MDELMSFFKGFDKTKLVTPLTVAYFMVGFIEIIAETNKDIPLTTMTKPLLMPLLLLIYISATKKYNMLFILGLLAAWIGNIFLISQEMDMVMIGSVFFLVYRIFITLMAMRIAKFPGTLPMILGALPFLFLYLFVTNMAYDELGPRFVIFVVQGLLVIFFGGFCVGNYILKSSKSNTYLLISTILFTFAQFIIVLKIFYKSHTVLQPLSMLTFIFGQYLLYQFLLLEEKKRRRHKSVSSKRSGL